MNIQNLLLGLDEVGNWIDKVSNEYTKFAIRGGLKVASPNFYLKDEKGKAEIKLKAEIDILCKESLDNSVQFFEDKELFIQETGYMCAMFIEFLIVYFSEKIKTFKREKNQLNFELKREVPKNNIKEIIRISKNAKVLLVELENGKYQFLKAKNSPVYYDDVQLVESYVICRIGNKQYLCDLNGLDVKKDYVITSRNGNYIKLVKDCNTKKDKSKIDLILKDKSYYEVGSTQEFKELNIVALEVKSPSNTEKGIYLRDFKGRPVVDEKVKATLKSCHILKGKSYLENQEFKYLSVIEKNERNTKREFGGNNKTFEKKEYLIIPIFENTEHIYVVLEDLIKFKGNIKKDDVAKFEKKKKEHIEYKKVLSILKVEYVTLAKIYVLALYKDYNTNKEFLKVAYIAIDKEYDRIYETFNEIREKNDLKNLLYYNEISDEIDNICNKYI